MISIINIKKTLIKFSPTLLKIKDIFKLEIINKKDDIQKIKENVKVNSNIPQTQKEYIMYPKKQKNNMKINNKEEINLLTYIFFSKLKTIFKFLKKKEKKLVE